MPSGPVGLRDPERTARHEAKEVYGKLPLSFEANRGQADGRVMFLARGHRYAVLLTPAEAVLVLREPAAPSGDGRDSAATELAIKLVGANPQLELVGFDELPGKVNYFVGSDPTRWRTNIPTFAKVRLRDVYPGVDLVYRGNQRQLEYDFLVRPGAEPRGIRLAFKGADKLRLDGDGNVILQTGAGEFIQYAPIVYQETNGLRRQISSRYVLHGRDQVGFQFAAYDPSKLLIIDPTLSYSTYLGGSSSDRGFGIAVDVSGDAYVTGDTASIDFPTAKPFQRVGDGFSDVFVTKLNSTGSGTVYSTYLGGTFIDQPTSIAVDASGYAYVTGLTLSSDFPTANPLQPARSGSADAFVAKLNPKGSALVYSTYLGGTSSEKAFGIAADAFGNAYVTGFTSSTDFPTASPLQGAFAGFADAFVAKLSPTGSALVYSTYLGGSDLDVPTGIAVDASGSSYVTGITQSTNFPTANPLQRRFSGDIDAFVAKLSPAGSALAYSTYLGGISDDRGVGIGVDASSNAYVTGFTASPNFPTVKPLQRRFGGVFDAFVTKLNPAGSALVYSTYLGGSSSEKGLGIAVDASGNAYVTGETSSTDFPTASPLQPNFGGVLDGFVAKLNPTGFALVYSTYLGGSDFEAGNSIAVDASGNAYVTGNTASTNFPTTTKAVDTSCGTDGLCNGSEDAFVSKISD